MFRIVPSSDQADPTWTASKVWARLTTIFSLAVSRLVCVVVLLLVTLLSPSAFADRCSDRKEIPWVHDTPMDGEPGTWEGVPPQEWVEQTLKVQAVSMSALDDGTGMAVVLAGISRDDGAVSSDPVYWPGLKLQTEITRCDEHFCYTNVPATRYELETCPDAQVSVCVLPHS